MKNVCANLPDPGTCCSVEAVVSMDSKGQIIIPKDLREKAGFSEGDKFSIISCCSSEKVRCLALVKVDNLKGMVKDFLGPMFSDFSSGKSSI
ncbi:MAG: hypothetical protein A2096_16115 [Spirochaetes bacterium GWF1_41_5]|nr:MAG: hypothetical protein A2096_16115 [Spirochaetes bacterium GWF1_41_5]